MSKKVILFYANWCGHCQTFKPIWENLKVHLDNNGIEHEEYESSNQKIMDDFDIQGFPTIKVIQNNVATDYNGQRNPDAILNYLGVQTGGGVNTLSESNSISMPSEIQFINLNQNGGNLPTLSESDTIQLPSEIEFIDKNQNGGFLDILSESDSILLPSDIQVIDMNQKGGNLQTLSESDSVFLPFDIKIVDLNQTGGNYEDSVDVSFDIEIIDI